jgi:holo-[acyl-carrier protein] synthase
MVIKCAACDSSGRQTRAGPAESCTHSKPPLGLGNVNIIGLGLDATDIPRISDTIKRYGERFTHRIFTDGEVAYCMRRHTPAIHFAGRFAAKEAAMKALGTGHSQGVLWRDVEVVRRGGPPQLRLHGGAARRFAAMGGRTSLLTITHSDALALAEVLILGD